MKYLIVLFSVIIVQPAFAQERTLTQLWETDSISFPESALCTKDFLYVSLLDHYPMREHGKGKIAKVGLDGKIINAKWIVGLDGPKGMGIMNGKLYVADITQIVVIDINKGKIEKKIPVAGSIALNDLTIDAHGILYVSDPDQGIIYRVSNGHPKIYLTKIPGVNGLMVVGNELYLVASSDVFRFKHGKLSSLSKFHSGADGLASLGNGDFLVTVYSGLIYYLNKMGKLELLLDTQSKKVGSADIEFDAKTNIVYVPTLYHNSIVAYQMK